MIKRIERRDNTIRDYPASPAFNNALHRVWSQYSKLNPQKIASSQAQLIMQDIDLIADEGLVSTDDRTFITAAMELIDYGHHVPSERHSIFEYEGPNKEIYSRAIYASVRHLDSLIGYLTSDRKDSQMRKRQEYSMHLINLMAEKNVGEEINCIALGLYEQLISVIINGVLTGRFNFGHALEIYTRKTPEVWPNIMNEIKRQMNSIPLGEFRPRLYSLLQFPDEQTRISGEVIAKLLFRKFGFSSKEIDRLFKDWSRDLWPWKGINYLNIDSNIDAIFELEQSVPGITRWLISEFGIKHPGRYNSELLFNQYINAEDRTILLGG